MHLKSTAQVAWERGRKFHKTLKQRSPDLYNIFEEYSLLPSMNTKNSRIRKTPMEFAKSLRPTFYYSEDHFTENTAKCIIQNPNVDNYQVEKTNLIES